MNGKQILIFVAALALSVGGEVLLLTGPHPGGAWWFHVPGFFAVFGFFICLGLAFLAKLLGKLWLQRDERYYQRGELSDD